MNDSLVVMNKSEPLGLAVFDSLRAEGEPWLAQCYLPPADFPLMARWRSALIFGHLGSGKTALRLALEREWCPPNIQPPLLLVHWPMTISTPPELTGTPLVQEYVGQVLDIVARSFLQHLSQCRTDWGRMPPWVRNTLTWFVQHHLRGDLVHYVASLVGEVSAEGLALLREVAVASVPDVLCPGTPTPLTIAELLRSLQMLGLEGVRIVVDGLEPWVAVDVKHLVGCLEPFLAALAQFEHPRFAYTMLLPAELESPLWSAGSIARRRVDTYSLKWGTAMLCAMIQRRLALALGEDGFTLERLGPTERLLSWLERCGGELPRGWLQTIQPFLVAYVAKAVKQGERKPLTADQCLVVQKRHPPRLFMELDTGRVTIGWREVPDLPTGPLAVLRYLYEHRGHICSREKIYRAYTKATYDKPDDEAFPKEYAGLLDTLLWRLRRAIEPDPEHPLLVISVRRKGVRLDNAW